MSIVPKFLYNGTLILTEGIGYGILFVQAAGRSLYCIQCDMICAAKALSVPLQHG